MTGIIQNFSSAVGFVLGQDYDITIPEVQKCLKAIKKVMKQKHAIPLMVRERKAA